MSDVAQPADYAEAIAWFNECVAWRQQDRERRMFLAGRVAELEATIETMRAQHTDLLDDLDTLDGKYVAAQAELAALKDKMLCMEPNNTEAACLSLVDERDELKRQLDLATKALRYGEEKDTLKLLEEAEAELAALKHYYDEMIEEAGKTAEELAELKAENERLKWMLDDLNPYQATSKSGKSWMENGLARYKEARP